MFASKIKLYSNPNSNNRTQIFNSKSEYKILEGLWYCNFSVPNIWRLHRTPTPPQKNCIYDACMYAAAFLLRRNKWAYFLCDFTTYLSVVNHKRLEKSVTKARHSWAAVCVLLHLAKILLELEHILLHLAKIGSDAAPDDRLRVVLFSGVICDHVER